MIKRLSVIRYIFLCLFVVIGCKQNSLPSESFGVVSLSPSITRQIVDLDAERLLVGVTSFHPPLSRDIASVGTLVAPNFEKILLLKPAVVLFSLEDSLTQRLDPLKTSGLVLHGFSRNTNFEAVCANYIELGRLIGKEKQAVSRTAAYREELAAARCQPRGISVLLLVSWEPLISVSDGTFIGHVIKDAGGKNIFPETAGSYPIITPEAVALCDPDVVIIMSEGNSEGFLKRFRAFSMRAVRNGNVFTIKPDHIAYFTPKDYIMAVNEIAEILANISVKNITE